MPASFKGFYNKHLQYFTSSYPSTVGALSTESLSFVLSPFQITLDRKIYQTIEKAIAGFYRLRSHPAYIGAVGAEDSELLGGSTSQAAVLMAYDFHVDPLQGKVGLIEINTNASGFLLAQGLYTESETFSRALNELKNSFLEEMKSCSSTEARNVAIIDSEPQQQKMYGEFLMYKDLISSWGYNCEICDYRELKKSEAGLTLPSLGQVDFVYNRLTDFLFSEPESKTLREAYLARQTCFSPHPREYLLLADKGRLVDITRQGWLESLGISQDILKDIHPVLLATRKLSDFSSPEEAWQKRKNYFFKPSRSFGGKSAYRGSSITQKVFERIKDTNTLVQEFMPAPEIAFESGSETLNFKYDLRFFVYRDRIQLATARLYQGQTTNFRRELGGFSQLVLQ